jgi:hypothetical protein
MEETTLKDSEKTVPYRLSEAELENLRLLRKRMNPSGSIQDDEEENKTSEALDGEANSMKTTTFKNVKITSG